ncbi:MAG TPA: prepilin-type N-terminal cleavage/methylation domain-containing protein [Candidatus Sulfotelmatobacter sp.]|nr:prepilin-type N-terminal cleavage/methylation domain-containing protein [Candidatus Sulfotelmatobacter sp.]
MNRNQSVRKQKGFTLIEAMIAMAVLSFGILSLASIFTQGLKASSQTQIQYIAQQKAQEAMETIFTARDTRLLTSAQINNVSNGGVFMDGPQPLLAPGPDGLFGTADDDAANPDGIVIGPGPDKIFGTADDLMINLNPWMTRTILIQPVPNTPNLKSITVTINWNYVGQSSQYQLVSFISNFS